MSYVLEVDSEVSFPNYPPSHSSASVTQGGLSPQFPGPTTSVPAVMAQEQLPPPPGTSVPQATSQLPPPPGTSVPRATFQLPPQGTSVPQASTSAMSTQYFHYPCRAPAVQAQPPPGTSLPLTTTSTTSAQYLQYPYRAPGATPHPRQPSPATLTSTSTQYLQYPNYHYSAPAVPVPAATPHLKTHLPDRFLGNATEDFSVWLGKFEVYADAHQYTPDVRVRILPTFLDGPALNYIQGLDQDVRRDYPKLLAALSQAFSQDRYIFTFRQALAQRRRQPGESFMVFATELTSLVKRAYPTYNEPAILGQTLQLFIQGVDPATRLRVMESGALTINKAVEIATRHEQAVAVNAQQDTCENTVNSVQRDDLQMAVAGLTEQVHILTTLLQRQQLSQTSSSRGRSVSPFRPPSSDRSRSPYRSPANSRPRSPFRSSDNNRPTSPYRAADHRSRSPYRSSTNDRPRSPYSEPANIRGRSPSRSSGSDRPSSPSRQYTDSRSRSPYRQSPSDHIRSRSSPRTVRFAEQGNDLPLMPRAGHQ